MDFLFFSTIRGVLMNVLVAYDIACQWYKNLGARMMLLSNELQPSISVEKIQAKVSTYHLIFECCSISRCVQVGVFHIQAHESRCHAPWGLALTRGAGRTDGEAIERLWSNLNGAASSTKEMGPGSRQDTLDGFCGFNNWRKLNLLREFISHIHSLPVISHIPSSCKNGQGSRRSS
jgi:hypothetical protein